MEITRKHLKAFYLYEGKQDSLNRIGTKKEKLLFNKGEFQYITNLIELDSLNRKGELTIDEQNDFERKLKTANLNRRNKKTITFLSKKFHDKDNYNGKQSNVFIEFLWLITDILKGLVN